MLIFNPAVGGNQEFRGWPSAVKTRWAGGHFCMWPGRLPFILSTERLFDGKIELGNCGMAIPSFQDVKTLLHNELRNSLPAHEI